MGLVSDFDCDKAHPMISDGKHEVENEGFFLVVSLKIKKRVSHFSPFVFSYDQVLILELPSERVELKLVVVSKDIEVLEVLQT